MKLADGAQDLFGVDPRARGFGKDLADTPSDSTTQFADVLSDLGSAVEADASADPTVDRSFSPAVAIHGQADLGIKGASITIPSADYDVSDGHQSKYDATVRNCAATPVGANLEEFAIRAAFAPTTSQPTPTEDVARSVDALRKLGTAPEAIQPPGAPGIMIPSNPSASKSSTVSPGDASRRPPIAKEPYRDIATQLEMVGATPSKTHRVSGPKSTETGLTSEPSAANHRQPESCELMAVLFGGLNNAYAPVAQTSSQEPISAIGSIAAVAIQASEATDISRSPPGLGPPAGAIPGPVAAADPSATPAMEGLSVISTSTHLAPSGNRATSSLNTKIRGASTMPQNSVGETRSGNPGSAAAGPVMDSQALTSASPGEPAAGDGDNDTMVDRSADVRAAQRTHDFQGGEPTVRNRDPSQSNEVTPTESSWLMQGSRPIAKIAAAVTKLAAPVAVSPASSPVSVAPARTLTLRLEQAGLGPIDIRMHVSGATLDLHLAVADHETLTILQRNREALTSAIADRQYQVHSLTIQDSSAVPTSANSTGQGDPGAGTGTRADADAQASGNQRGDRSNGHRESSSYRQDDKPPPSRARDPRRGSLFV